MFILLASIAFAATSAKIVTDSTSPGCYEAEEVQRNCHSLEAIVDSGDSVVYTVEGVEPDTTYTASFMYNIDPGSVGVFEFSIDGIDADSITLDKRRWTPHSVTFTTSENVPDEVKLKFRATGGNAKFYLDNIQFTPSPEPTAFVNFKYEKGCCPADFCYTGGVIPEHPSCIHDDFYEKNVSMPPIGWELADFGGKLTDPSSFLDAPTGYRCINGTWTFSRAKTTPLYDRAGFCPRDDQCFIYADSGLAEDACVESGTFHKYSDEWYYCHKGNWTTRTKEIALQMLDMTGPDDTYTIFCDKYDRSLNPDETGNYYRDYLGDNVAALVASDMVNEFCILELNGKVIAGVSLNQEINETLGGDDCVPGGIQCLTEGMCEEGCLINPSQDLIPPSKSFLEMLKGPEHLDYCDSAIQNTDGQYNECSSRDIYYNSKLKTVLFTKPHQLPLDERQVVPLVQTETLFDVIFNYLRGILQNLIGIGGLATPQTEAVQQQNLDFIEKAGSFDKLYISHSPEGPNGNPRAIRAIRETRAHKRADVGVTIKTFISAEYFNYQANICNFFYKHNYLDLREQISKNNNIQCTPVISDNEQWMHSIYVEEPAFEEIPQKLEKIRIWKPASDSFWNDLTSKIRTQPIRSLPGTSPPTPDFITAPAENPVAGGKIAFSIYTDEPEGQKFIARTWDFGDGNKASSAFNITTWHMYDAPAEYDITLCVMNQNYQISCTSPTTIDVGPGPSVSIQESLQTDEQKQNGEVTVEFKLTGGIEPYTIKVEWGDGSTSTANSEGILGDEEITYENNIFTATHQYEFETGHVALDFIINASGRDGSDHGGVKFDNWKKIIVEKE